MAIRVLIFLWMRASVLMISEFILLSELMIRFPVPACCCKMGIKFVTFVDAGNAYLENEPIDLTEVRSNWGAGIRWNSPLGPLRFELGFPFDRQEGERASQFNFAVGSPFR